MRRGRFFWSVAALFAAATFLIGSAWAQESATRPAEIAPPEPAKQLDAALRIPVEAVGPARQARVQHLEAARRRVAEVQPQQPHVGR